MRFSTLAMASAATLAAAQRPSGTPICDYYTTALLKNNTAANQATLLTLLVNTVVIGNYTMPNVGVSVPGILANGTINGTAVSLLPYFNGKLASSNRGGKAVAVNFLDGGGADPLKNNKPANDMSSNQYFLLTHLYQFFGSLLGCSMQGMSGFDAYSGQNSMYTVHKFMDLNYAQNTYFITQVGLAAASFGVAKDDITAVATALGNLFNVKCGPATAVIKGSQADLQSICVDPASCPQAVNATCDKYDANPVLPATATSILSSSMSATGTSSMASGTNTGSATGTATGSGTATGTAKPTTSAGAAVPVAVNMAAVAAGVAAFLL